uniref:NAD-dependent epimerase/dehydratase domain-containing protein n=1 Tax=Kalanchoe fedtschenkoi TaxID=63787 RepID=A0A7N0UTQ2_KALFE
MEKGRVCVTGAGGFIGSWLVKLLLSKGYVVHGTLREPSDQKYAHLWTLDKAAENLKVFKADLLDYQSILTALEGCDGVFHVASPVPSSSVPNPEKELIEPAVKGTLNVLKGCSEAKVKRAIVLSSIGAIKMNPAWPKGQVKDEACWSDVEYCKKTGNWYFASKTEAELLALEYAEKSGLGVVTICPILVLGPVLQSTLNASSLALIKLLKGVGSVENVEWRIVDVRDLAEALLLVYEKPEAKGRYLCLSHAVLAQELVGKLQSMYPNYNYPKSFVEVELQDRVMSDKLQKIGWTYRPLEETLADSIKSYRQLGYLD